MEMLSLKMKILANGVGKKSDHPGRGVIQSPTLDVVVEAGPAWAPACIY